MSFARFTLLSLTQPANWHSLALAAVCVSVLSFNQWSVYKVPALAAPGENNSSQEAELDAALQKAADEALGDREGAIIVMDAQTGRIRALHNSELAFATPLMPGSTMKPFTALAALRSGLITEDSRTVCPGRFTGRSFSVACVHADHLPPFTPSQAIAYSCNYYFATLGQRLGRDKLIDTAQEFGLGQPAGAASDEVASLRRPCETGSGARLRTGENNHASDQSDCTAREAIGESDHLLVTPGQLLSAYAALINGGHLFEPRSGRAAGFLPVERSRINISTRQRAIIAEGMAGAVRYGTARSARLDSLPVTILGKTGTALPAKGFRTNGWFVGLAGPFQSNREVAPAAMDLAVLVLLTHAHGSQAAVVAKPIFEAYAETVSHRNTESQNLDQPNVQDRPSVGSTRLPLSTSSIRVHLVHDNVTQELSLEDYVLGVLRAEGTLETKPEALKALAVAVRTFAMRNIGRHDGDGYDFCSTTHCQRFVLGSNSAALVAAVKSTEGQVLTDDRGQVVDSYFSASCGGETADIGALWGGPSQKYLTTIHDEYCVSGPHATWRDVIPRGELLRALRSDPRTDVGNRLDDVIVSKQDESGRAEFITLAGERRKIVRGWDFKIIVGRVLGWNVLKSSRLEVSRAGSNFIFRGRGFGHGLGLCQEGAHVMAARGMNYQKILEKYFPGTAIRNERVAGRLSVNQSPDSTAAVAFAVDRSENSQVRDWNLDISLRNAVRPLPLRLSHHAVAKRTLTISSEHFRVTYPADGNRRDADDILTVLEAARADYLHRASAASIAISSLPFLEIRVNESTGDFTSRTGQPWWAAAATKGNQIELQPVTILKKRGLLTTTLRHELAHVIIDAISNKRPPRWLEEGFALHLAGEGRLISSYAKREALSNEELEKRLDHPTSQQEMRALYARAYLNIAELIRSQGEAGIWKKLAAG